MWCISHYSSANCSLHFQLVSLPHLHEVAYSAVKRPSRKLQSCWSSGYWFSPRKYVACCKWNLPSDLQLPLSCDQQVLFSPLLPFAGESCFSLAADTWCRASDGFPSRLLLLWNQRKCKTDRFPLQMENPHFFPNPLQPPLQTLFLSGVSGGGAVGLAPGGRSSEVPELGLARAESEHWTNALFFFRWCWKIWPKQSQRASFYLAS